MCEPSGRSSGCHGEAEEALVAPFLNRSSESVPAGGSTTLDEEASMNGAQELSRFLSSLLLLARGQRPTPSSWDKRRERRRACRTGHCRSDQSQHGRSPCRHGDNDSHRWALSGHTCAVTKRNRNEKSTMNTDFLSFSFFFFFRTKYVDTWKCEIAGKRLIFFCTRGCTCNRGNMVLHSWAHTKTLSHTFINAEKGRLREYLSSSSPPLSDIK